MELFSHCSVNLDVQYKPMYVSLKIQGLVIVPKGLSFVNQIESQDTKREHIFVFYSKAVATAEMAEAIAFLV